MYWGSWSSSICKNPHPPSSGCYEYRLCNTGCGSGPAECGKSGDQELRNEDVNCNCG